MYKIKYIKLVLEKKIYFFKKEKYKKYKKFSLGNTRKNFLKNKAVFQPFG